MDSFDLATNSTSSEKSTSVIAALMKRFREAPPAPPEKRQLSINREDLWWIGNRETTARNDKIGRTDDYARNHVEECVIEDESHPRVGLGLSRTLQGRHDGGNEPNGIWQQYGTSDNTRIPLNPFAPLANVAASQVSAIAPVIETDDSVDLDAYAAQLLEKCEEFVRDFNTTPATSTVLSSEEIISKHQIQALKFTSEPKYYSSDTSGTGPERTDLAEMIRQQSTRDGILAAYDLHMQQVGASSSQELGISTDDSGSLVGQNQVLEVAVHAAGLGVYSVEAEDTLPSEHEIAATSVVIFPEQSARSPPRYFESADVHGTVQRRRLRMQSSPAVPVVTSAATEGNVFNSKNATIQASPTAARLMPASSPKTGDSLIFPLYLSSSGELSRRDESHLRTTTTYTKEDIARMSASGHIGTEITHAHGVNSVTSAFELARDIEGEVTVSMSMDSEQLLRYQTQNNAATTISDDGAVGVSQELDGEVTVRGSSTFDRSALSSVLTASLDTLALPVLREESKDKPVPLSWTDVAPYADDEVTIKLWGMLCDVRAKIAATTTVNR